MCKGSYTAWSNACPARKKEMERIEIAKQSRRIYWHVPPKARTTATTRNESHTRDHNSGSQPKISGTPRTPRTPATPRVVPSRTTSRNREERQQSPQHHEDNEDAPIRPPQPQTDNDIPIDPRLIRRVTHSQPVQATPAKPEQVEEPARERVLSGHSGDNLATPSFQRASLPQFDTDEKRIGELREELIRAAARQDADDWLDGIVDQIQADDERLDNIPEDELSRPTSHGIEAQTANRGVLKGCDCPEHQATYENWPMQNARLTIAKCMRICMYCGKDFHGQ